MPAILDGGTLVIPRHKAARLTITPDTGSLSEQSFVGGGAIFTLAAGANANEKRILPTGVIGTESLAIAADGDPNDGQIPIRATIQVEVRPGLAVRLEFLYEMLPDAQARKIPQTGGAVDLPMNRTARVTVTAYDAEGDVVALSSQFWTGGSRFDVAATADPNVVDLQPLSTGAAEDLTLDADADISGDTVAIQGVISVSVVNGLATTFTMSYAIEAP